MTPDDNTAARGDEGEEAPGEPTAGSTERIPGVDPDSAPFLAGPARRRLTMLLGLFFLALILFALFLLILAGERSDRGASALTAQAFAAHPYPPPWSTSHAQHRQL